MKTLLKRDWSSDMLCQVPVTFMTQVLLPALLSPVHHNTTLAASLAASGAVLEPHKQQEGTSSSSGSFSVTAQAGQLLCSWAACAEPAAVRQLFMEGLELVASPTQEVSKSGLHALLQVLAAAAEQLVRKGHRVLGGLPQTEAGALLCDQPAPWTSAPPTLWPCTIAGTLSLCTASNNLHCFVWGL